MFLQGFCGEGILKGYRILELSFDLYPGKEEYHLDLKNRPVAEMLPFYADKVPLDEWYVMSEVEFWSHVGTHIEAPLHHIDRGMDCAEIPLANVVGEASLVDFTQKPLFEGITLEELKSHANHVQQGDILFIRTGLHPFYRTERSHDRPYLMPEATEWLVYEKRISCLGVDCSGIEKRDEPTQPNHKILLGNGIPIIEHLAYLDRISKKRFFVVAVPMRVHGLDASPVSVIAFEPIDGMIDDERD
jgi:arylformamidase